jgi:hypothetical protein
MKPMNCRQRGREAMMMYSWLKFIKEFCAFYETRTFILMFTNTMSKAPAVFSFFTVRFQ